MIPYGTFSFFGIVAILLVPTIICGLRGINIRSYNMIVTVIMLVLIFSNNWTEFLFLIFFTIWQVLLIKSYIFYRKKANHSFWFYLAVFVSILPLLLTKLVPTFYPENWIGFLGISYLTFKGVQIIIEARDGVIKKNPPLPKLLYFILFFPTISSGPIDRYRRFEKDYHNTFTNDEYQNFLYWGLIKIFRGFLYKYIIGYAINNGIMIRLSSIPFHKTGQSLLYMYAYSLYLFFDFAGYSAFAIGVSYLLGVRTPENFNKPFLSRNIKDFWDRWHISLSYWFRDFVFMRFVFLLTKKKWIKSRLAVSNIGYVLLFTLMGIWHGLAIQYILYGLYHAFLMVGHNIFDTYNKKYNWWPDNTFTKIASIFITFHIICFGFYIFSGHLLK
jgi:membrane protein involved in D-alanine export